jgi:hypothetical protein
MFGKLGLFRKTRVGVKKVNKSFKKQTRKLFNNLNVLKLNKKRKQSRKQRKQSRKQRKQRKQRGG